MSSRPSDLSNEHSLEMLDRMRSFHSSLRAAVVAGTRLDLGSVDPRAPHASQACGGIATRSKIDALEALNLALLGGASEGRRVELHKNPQRPDSGRPFGEEGEECLPAGYLTAVRMFQQTGRIDLVLDCLSLRRTVASELSRALRPAWFYLALLLVLATIGLAVFSTFSAPQVAAIRADMELTPRVVISPPWISLPQLRYLLLVLPLLACGLIWLGISTNASATVAMLLGGRQYLSDRQRQLKANVEHATPDASGKSDDMRCRNRLRLKSENHGFRASNRLTQMRIGLPALMIAVVGGGGVLVYCLILFGPLIVLIRDMTTVAVDAGMWP